MSIGLIGTKIGMTREFMESGQSIPVTVIKIEKGRVLDIITKEKRGYSAVKVGFFNLKNSKLTKTVFSVYLSCIGPFSTQILNYSTISGGFKKTYPKILSKRAKFEFGRCFWCIFSVIWGGGCLVEKSLST